MYGICEQQICNYYYYYYYYFFTHCMKTEDEAAR